ncbi:unnamed protein product [Leptosia nina]|uniref:Uncharacterized protein n=1 Tax=Leptosia nina TaxID=320188 RepID=A0AAV1J8P4_9NEOP
MHSLKGLLVCFLIYHYVQAETSSSPSTPFDCTKRHAKKVNHIEECTKESRVNRNYIEKMKAGYWSMPKITTSLKYWAFCYLKRMDMMTEAGVLRQDVVLQQSHSKKEKRQIVKLIDKCMYDTAHLPLETAWHYLYCFHKANYKLCKRIHGI